jgi:Cft2 family RNA processing exonuclease
MFQGSPNETVRNRVPLGFDPSTLDAILVTHAHLDHCGYLPVVVKEGYAGPIYLTTATAELVEIVLLDSGKLQEEFAERHTRWVRRHPAEAIAADKGSEQEYEAAVAEAKRAEDEGHVPTSIEPDPPRATVYDPEVEIRQQPPHVEADLDAPLYTEADAQQVMPHFQKIRYGNATQVAPGVTATFFRTIRACATSSCGCSPPTVAIGCARSSARRQVTSSAMPRARASASASGHTGSST